MPWCWLPRTSWSGSADPSSGWFGRRSSSTSCRPKSPGAASPWGPVRGIVRRGQPIALDQGWLGEGEVDPAGRLEGKPLAVDVTIDRLGCRLVGRVLGTRRDFCDLRGDVAGDSRGRRPGHPGRLGLTIRPDLDGARPVDWSLPVLEGA